jgi:hypothetical protein
MSVVGIAYDKRDRNAMLAERSVSADRTVAREHERAAPGRQRHCVRPRPSHHRPTIADGYLELFDPALARVRLSPIQGTFVGQARDVVA